MATSKFAKGSSIRNMECKKIKNFFYGKINFIFNNKIIFKFYKNLGPDAPNYLKISH